MKTWVTLREGLATTWANKVPTALVAFLVAVMVAGTLATVGRTAAAEGNSSNASTQPAPANSSSSTPATVATSTPLSSRKPPVSAPLNVPSGSCLPSTPSPARGPRR
ncbi:hypothetical protein G7085_00090 [Tessaracoccus sp. HDW20]|nr:hypothetical protein [Tessaracoccus coleopterorum]